MAFLTPNDETILHADGIAILCFQSMYAAHRRKVSFVS